MRKEGLKIQSIYEDIKKEQKEGGKEDRKEGRSRENAYSSDRVGDRKSQEWK